MIQAIAGAHLDAAVVLAFAVPGFAYAGSIWWYVLQTPDGWAHRGRLYAVMLPPVGIAMLLGVGLGVSGVPMLQHAAWATAAGFAAAGLVWALSAALGPIRVSYDTNRPGTGSGYD